jgi:hypothetical protein
MRRPPTPREPAEVHYIMMVIMEKLKACFLMMLEDCQKSTG